MSAAETECYAMANIGQSVSSNGWRQYQTIVDKMVTRRAEVVTAGGNYIPVIGWRLNKVNRDTVKYIFHPCNNKFALLWGEAQLCLPYVCL